MRAIILLNPHVSVIEHINKGSSYADASIGFDYNGAIDDQAALAKHLREVAAMLEAKTVSDPEIL